MSLLKDLWAFMRARKKFWLAPIVIVLVIMSGLLVLGANAPWVWAIYPF